MNKQTDIDRPSSKRNYFAYGSTKPAGDDELQLVDAVLQSDAAYFRSAAQVEWCSGWQIVYMPGLLSLPAGCTVWPGAEYRRHLEVQAMEIQLKDLGCPHARLYQQCPDDALQQELVRNGYRPAEEIALLNAFTNRPCETHPAPPIRLVLVQSEQDWKDKLKLHQDIPRGPDNHASQAGHWLQMERAKCEAGFMQPFLILRGEEIAGAVNFAAFGNLGRLKNLVVHPAYRRQGVGAEAASQIAEMARERGKSAAGCFAMAGGQSVNLYRTAGYVPVARQIEWYKELQ